MGNHVGWIGLSLALVALYGCSAGELATGSTTGASTTTGASEGPSSAGASSEVETADPTSSGTTEPTSSGTTDLTTGIPEPAVCGDGVVGAGEACDNGDKNGMDGVCSVDCQAEEPVCGDGVVNGSEACDDGANNGPTQACTASCAINVCGDGFVGPAEACDEGPANADNGMCSTQCAVPVCGDGVLNAGEDCDLGPGNGNDQACTGMCKNAACGDGLVGPGEGCDDGNQVDDDACTNSCGLASCGDGIKQMGEACDDNNQVDTDACLATCVAASCGDGFVFSGSAEVCDDGNGVDDDACTNDCAFPACNDQVLNGDEWGPDCGGSCDPCTSVFTVDGNTLALFELNGDTTDSSGNARNAMLLGGDFVDTAWGQGLKLAGVQPQGFDWSAFTNLLVPPYTIEMVLTPQNTTCYQKLYSWNNNSDAGWYYCNGFRSYPNPSIGMAFPVDQRHYLSLVSVDGTKLDVYSNGTFLGSTVTGFVAPGVGSLFFKDDVSTNTEQLEGVIEAVRLSSVARTNNEIMAQQAWLALQP